jgi:hypothetical protein
MRPFDTDPEVILIFGKESGGPFPERRRRTRWREPGDDRGGPDSPGNSNRMARGTDFSDRIEYQSPDRRATGSGFRREDRPSGDHPVHPIRAGYCLGVRRGGRGTIRRASVLVPDRVPVELTGCLPLEPTCQSGVREGCPASCLPLVGPDPEDRLLGVEDNQPLPVGPLVGGGDPEKPARNPARTLRKRAHFGRFWPAFGPVQGTTIALVPSREGVRTRKLDYLRKILKASFLIACDENRPAFGHRCISLAANLIHPDR